MLVVLVVERGAGALLEAAREVLSYAVEELDRALKLGDVFLYRNAADKAFLALVLARVGVVPRSHGERRRALREMGREDLRALYSDLMKTLHEEALYEGVYQPDEVRYAVGRVERLIGEVEDALRGEA